MEDLVQIYRTCAMVSKLFSFEWRIKDDLFIYDEALQDMLPYHLPHKGIGQFLAEAEFMPDDDRKRFQKHLLFLLLYPFRQARRRRSQQILMRVLSPQGQMLYYRLTYALMIEDDGSRILHGTLQDITRYYRENAELKKSLQHDAMTGLYAKTYAPQIINQTLETDRECDRHHALLVLDIDHFKQVNDKLGHLIGDAVIIDLALALKMNFRPQDILGHIGGDEFVVFMPDADRSEVLARCDRLRNSMRRQLGHDDNEIKLTGSIGIAFAPEHGQDYETLFAHADSALYEAKRLGRDKQVIYYEEIEESSHTVDSSDRAALEYDELVEKPLDYIFRMVLHSDDTELSVRLLLEIFAKHFHVQRAYVFWNIDGSYWPRLLYEYKADPEDIGFRAHNPEVRRLMWHRYRRTPYGTFTECGDTTNLSPRTAGIFERAGIHAWMECAMMEGKEFLGGVGFDDKQGPHKWSKDEHKVLAAFANIMHRFLLGQIYFERTRSSGSIYL